ncbi:MAG: D-amino-acid transaminase [Rhodospirillales bacterium]|nr:D-amino-acid transaminase [Rhodospirillales bacterium]
MSRIAYVNGQYVPHLAASVHIEDRGYQFSDGVYEVIAIHKGKLIDMEGHIERLTRSLSELEITWPVTPRALDMIIRQVIRRNRTRDGIVYMQITRGVAPRNHAFPDHHDSALVITAKRFPTFTFNASNKGVDVITTPETRWQRRDIKTISLLGNCLAKEQAARAGCYEAWFVEDDGMVTEGTSSNAWIVTADGKLVTRNTSNAILNGITRLAILKLAKEQGVEFVERAFSVEEAKSAKEAFVSSTTSFVKPVLHIDGNPVGDGKVGSLSAKLLTYYGEHMKAQLV